MATSTATANGRSSSQERGTGPGSSSHLRTSPSPLRTMTSPSSNFSPSSTPPSSSFTPSASTSSAVSSSTTTSAALTSAVTAEALLSQHAAAANPPLAALDQALSERNLLSSQNQQLWKLVEKQRSGYNQIMKELERVRGERDGYKGRLVALGEGVEKDKEGRDKREKDAKPLKASASTPGINGRETPTGRAPLVRHQSDDHARTESSASYAGDPRRYMVRGQSDEYASPTITASRAIGQQQLARERQMSLDLPRPAPQTSAPASALRERVSSESSRPLPQPLKSLPPSSSSSNPTIPPALQMQMQTRMSPPPLVIPNRGESLGAIPHLNVPASTSALTPIPNSGSSSGSGSGSGFGGNDYGSGYGTAPSSALSPASTRPLNLTPRSNGPMTPAMNATTPMTATSLSQFPLPPSSGYDPRAQPQQPRAPPTGPPPPAPPALHEPPSSFPGPPPPLNNFNGGHAQSPPQQYQPQTLQPPSQSSLAPPGQGLGADARRLHRESRIELPDEASRYIANMVDSPAGSPATDAHEFASQQQQVQQQRQGAMPPPSLPQQQQQGFSGVPNGAQPSLNITSALNVPVRPSQLAQSPITGSGSESGSDAYEDDEDDTADPVVGASSARSAPAQAQPAAGANSGNNPFLDMDDDDNSTAEYGVSAQASTSELYQSHDSSSGDLYRTSEDTESAYDGSTLASVSQVTSQETAVNPASQPPYPAPPHHPPHLQHQHLQHIRTASGSGVDFLPADEPPTPGLPEQIQVRSPARGPSERPLSFMPPRKPSDQPMYRALPLLLSDLPRTRISVLQSSIRPNERGKDVLNFVIEVAPGSDKEPWKVEKLYSDVLGLDHRVRAAVGRSVSKKIATLPEGKMWRDHAPAKADLRKAALESYLTSLINLPIKNKDEVIAFFTSDIVRPSLQPVAQAGYKQGYLTKRGRNFGGWKSRYFVVQGPVLEYYESRGGGHLGSISITGAQIGRQQRSGNERREADDDNEYRHAFLIIEARKLPNGQHPRHVLCAESDEERDSWVEVLVRYVHGSYNEDTGPPAGAGQQAQVPGPINVQVQAPPRASSSSAQSPSDEAQVTPMGKKGTRTASKDNIVFGGAVPIAQLTPDAGNAKLMQAAPYPAALTIPIQQQSKENAISPINGPGTYSTSQMAKRILDGANASTPDVPVSTSLPESSPLSEAPGELVSIPRANSELGNYPDLLDPNRPPPSSGSPNDHRAGRKSYHPGLQTIAASPTVPVPPVADRPVTPESTPVKESKGKISGAFSGARLPGGFKFGSSTKEVQSSDAISTTSSTDRREKAKSRSFWGFGNKPQGSGADKPMPVSYGGRPVFGVPIEDALDVVQIGGLPAIAFRCIQYLETKKAEQEEGIYRLSGSSAVIKALKDRFNAEGDVDLLASDEYWDPHAIAGLLKTYLRELPTSVLTRDLHLRFLAVMDLVDQKERVHELKRLISRLPIANYSLLRALTAHLILIVQNSSINKMTMRNVGIVFSPTLGIPAGVFSLMLGEFNQVFNVSGEAAEEEESEPPSPDYEEDDVAPSAAAERAVLSRRNSHRYSDAAADQLLGLSGRTLAVPDESDEENASILIQEDSGSETAENETTESSTSAGRMPTYQDHLRPSDDPEQPSRSKAAAASRGLNITTGADRIRRQSRMIGLPHSPRPLQQNAQITSPNAPRSPSVPSSPVDTPK